MSWFQSTNLASFAKTALKEAQKTIDKALEINDAEREQQNNSTDRVTAVTEAASDFFASWGVTVGSKRPTSADSSCAPSPINTPREVITSSPKRKQSLQHHDEVESSSVHHHLTHKRSASLEANVPQTVGVENSMCKSLNLTSDVPVTLLGENQTFETSLHPHHSRSLSDTIFHSDATGGSSVQVLDFDEGSSSGAGDIDSHSNSITFKHPPTIQKHSIDINNQKVEESTLNLTLESKLEVKNRTRSGELNESDNSFSNLSLIDLNAPADHPADPVDNSELEVSEDVKNVENAENSQLLKSHDPCDINTDSWSWGGSSSGFVDVDQDGNTKSSLFDTKSMSPEKNEDKKTETEAREKLEKEQIDQEPVLLDSGFAASLNSESIQNQNDSSGENLVENSEVPQDETIPPQQNLTISTNNSSPASTIANLPETTPQNSTNDSSDSTSTLIISLPETSERTEPDPAEREVDAASPSSTNTNNDDLLLSKVIREDFTVESSRSSSIVVVPSIRSGSSGSRSAASSGGSSDGGDRDHHHEEGQEGSEGSPSFDRVDHPSSSDPTSPEFCGPKCGGGGGSHKKGPSSASSSDIEVILSAEYSQIHHHEINTHTETKMISVSSMHQQTSVELKDEESQTDFPEPPPNASTIDSIKAQLLADELPKQLTLEISEMLSEKDLLIEQLRDEGEKLSKKQFDLSQIIKKLRGKEKESENSINKLKGELAGKSLENERLTKSFVNKEASELGLNETVQKLQSGKRTLELQVGQLKSELEDAKENCSTMKASVEDASVEILELKNAILTAQRDSTELDILTREKCELLSRSESLQKEIESLRLTINSLQGKSSSRESELSSSVSTLTRKIHLLEMQLSDVSSEMADATMPLSLEIEKLQTELKNSLQIREKRESQLLQQLGDAEGKLQAVFDREKTFKNKELLMQNRISEMEEKATELEQENRELRRQLDERIREEETKAREDKESREKLERQISRLTEENSRLAKENDSLSLELKSEKSTSDQERKRSQSLLDQLTSSGRSVNLNNLNQRPNSNSHSNSNSTITGHKSGDNSPTHSLNSEASYLDEVFDPNNHRNLTPKSFFDSFSVNSFGLMETLQNQLRQREMEVMQLQDEGGKNERIRKSLNEEIAKLTMRNQECQIEVQNLAELKEKLGEMEGNYNAVLQMYGEKVEEADELRMDLQDVKDMYKAQIEQLLKR